MELPQSRLIGTGHRWDPCLRRRPADPAGGGAATVHSPENDRGEGVALERQVAAPPEEQKRRAVP